MSDDNVRRPGSANPSQDGRKEPARSESQPGPTYENPNEGQTYEPPQDSDSDGDEEHQR